MNTASTAKDARETVNGRVPPLRKHADPTRLNNRRSWIHMCIFCAALAADLPS
jgi:hypothetical protein